jgi:transcriptional regulator with XRE-family HTH domain
MTTKHEQLMLDPEYRKIYAIEGLIADAAQLICDLLERRKMKQADLARLLNKTPAFVSQLLNGKANMTVRTLAEVVHALGASVKLDAYDENMPACENLEDAEMHTLRIHFSSATTYKNYVPKHLVHAFKLSNQMSEHERAARLWWEEPGTDPSESRDSDSRPGYAA